jgi:hypothetical protein
MTSGGAALNNKGIRLTKAKTNKNNPDKLAKATDGLPAAPVAQVSNPSDARETLENGSVAGIGRYLHDDVAPLLRLIAERRHQPKQEVTKPLGYDLDQEFEYETEDMRWAIENGHSGLVDDFLRQLAGFLRPLGDMLDPAGRGEFQLNPVRRRKGKPKNQKQAILEGNIHRDLRFARIRLGGKLEAAISEVGEKYNCSRATLMRVWAKYEHSRTRT